MTASLIFATGLALVTRSKRVDKTKEVFDAKREVSSPQEKPSHSSPDGVPAQNEVGQALANSSVVLIPQLADKSSKTEDEEEPLPETTPAEDTKELCRFLWRFLSSR